MNKSRLSGFGHYLPGQIVTNEDLSKVVDTDDAWIRERTGIRQRHICPEGEDTAVIAYRAAQKALESAGIGAQDIDMIVLATTTPVNPFPATAVKVQAMLGAAKAFAFDVQAVCSGFVFALSVADNAVKTGQARKVLVIGAEQMSRLIDWNDRTTCVLFGDGAGAVVLEAVPADHEAGILSVRLHSDGNFYDILKVDDTSATPGCPGFIRMNGREVYRHAVTNMTEAMQEVLHDHGLDITALDRLVPHQANIRIIQTIAANLKLPMEKVIVTVDRHANTSAATIPLALSEAVADGRLRPGHLVGLVSMGAGATWGSALLRL